MQFRHVDAIEYSSSLVNNGALVVTGYKTGPVIVRKAIPGEIIDVYTNDGNLEIREIGEKGRYILTRANESGAPVIDAHGHKNCWQIDRKSLERNYDISRLDAVPDEGKTVWPKKLLQQFVQVWEDIIIDVPFGPGGTLIGQRIHMGGFLNITSADRIYGIAAEELYNTYVITSSRGKDCACKKG